ncbi:MAG: DNA polymerase III subunit gamma/tau, partial [Paracoccaceae bacterium]
QPVARSVPAPATAEAPRAGLRMAASGGDAGALPAASPAPAAALAAYPDFETVVALIRDRRDGKLLYEVETNLRLVSYSPGRIEFEPGPTAPRELAAMLSQRLQLWTGARWAVSVVAGGGAPSIAERRAAKAAANPLVAAILAAFPKAKILPARPLATAAPAAATDEADETGANDGLPDDWDPFEDN